MQFEFRRYHFGSLKSEPHWEEWLPGASLEDVDFDHARALDTRHDATVIAAAREAIQNQHVLTTCSEVTTRGATRWNPEAERTPIWRYQVRPMGGGKPLVGVPAQDVKHLEKMAEAASKRAEEAKAQAEDLGRQAVAIHLALFHIKRIHDADEKETE